jgi:hypothetical protein
MGKEKNSLACKRFLFALEDLACYRFIISFAFLSVLRYFLFISTPKFWCWVYPVVGKTVNS